MNRRIFLKTGLGLSSAWALYKIPGVSFALTEGGVETSSYEVGEPISREVFVFDNQSKRYTVFELCQNSGAAVVMLYLYGGGAMENFNRVGGLWCPDSFDDTHVMRFIDYKYLDSEVAIVPVSCPPVYSSQYYGLEEGVFMNEPEDSEAYQKAVEKFIDSTEQAVYNKFVPVPTYYDFRFRLLFNREANLKPGESYGAIHDWQGKFRAPGETQRYGTPTIWLLDANGIVLAEPFHGNVYHSDPFQLNYCATDVDKTIQKFL